VGETQKAVPGIELVERARNFATAAHRGVGQLRKYTGQPYEEHLRRVAAILEQHTGDPEMIAAAWLHDVVEDTPATIEDVEREFGSGVRELVDALTDVSRPHDGNRAERKALDREHLAGAPARAQTVKLADLMDNCDDICRHNRGFGRIFLTEMRQLLEVLTRADPKLLERAWALHDKWVKRLPPRLPAPVPDEAAPVADRIRDRMGRTLQHFARAFRADDIAEPVAARDPSVESASRTQLVSGEAPLTCVIEALFRHDACFVTDGEGRVCGRIGRAQIQGPVVRMWLFGMITTIEWMVTEDIRASRLDWTGFITPARLEKAKSLQASRALHGREVPLLDCLQLSDKVRIHQAIDDNPRPLFRGASKAESQRLVRDLEDLRNSLAHAQDIVTHDWTQVVRLARRLDELAGG
jgi:hypothetical protein